MVSRKFLGGKIEIEYYYKLRKIDYIHFVTLLEDCATFFREIECLINSIFFFQLQKFREIKTCLKHSTL